MTVVLTMNVATVHAQDAYDSIVMVLDGSGSMEGRLGTGESKMRAAKDAIFSVLSKVDENTHIGILGFGSVGSGQWIYQLAPVENLELLRQSIERLRPSGSTPLGNCIKLGADALLEDRASRFGYGSSTLLVVTDGEANDPWLVDQYAPELVARGIRLDVIGVAMKQEHTLAKIAHGYRSADDPESLERAVSSVVAEVTAGAVQAIPGEGAFELAAVFEPETAMQLIAALASSGNHPIGETPTSESKDASNRTQTLEPLDRPRADSKNSFARIVVGFFLFFAAALFWLIRSASKSRS